MDYALCIFVALFSTAWCAAVNNHSDHETAQVRKRETAFRELMACGLTRDASCFLDAADVLVEERMDDVLGEQKGAFFARKWKLREFWRGAWSC